LGDVLFVALTISIDGSLWTGDKKLYNGLKSKGFKKVINTNELEKILQL
jgi:predicted nucleic acid-binding protein